jgi:hypothetical protein
MSIVPPVCKCSLQDPGATQESCCILSGSQCCILVQPLLYKIICMHVVLCTRTTGRTATSQAT